MIKIAAYNRKTDNSYDGSLTRISELVGVNIDTMRNWYKNRSKQAKRIKGDFEIFLMHSSLIHRSKKL